MLITKNLKAAPTSPAIETLATRFVLTYAAVTDPDHDHYEVRRYLTATAYLTDEIFVTTESGLIVTTEGGTPILMPSTFDKKFEGIYGLKMTDNDVLTLGNTYYYVVYSIDKYGNRSEPSSVVSAAYRIVESTDLGAEAVLPSNLFPRDQGNLIRDSEMIEVALWEAKLGIGTILPISQFFNEGKGASRYGLRFSRASISDAYLRSDVSIPVESGKKYFVEMQGGFDIAVSNMEVYLFLDWYNIDSSGNFVYLSTSMTGYYNATGFKWSRNGVLTAPSNAQIAALGVQFASTFHSSVEFSITGPIVRRVMTSNDYGAGTVNNAALAADAVDTANIVDNAVTTGIETTSNAGGLALTASTANTVLTHTVNYEAGVNYIEVDFEFVNNSGSYKYMDITLEDNATAGASVLRTWTNIGLDDRGFFSGRMYIANPSGTSKTLYVRVNPTTAANVNRRRVDTIIHKR